MTSAWREPGRGLEEEEGPEAHGPEIIALLDTSASPEQYASRRKTRWRHESTRSPSGSTASRPSCPRWGRRGFTFNQFLVDAERAPALPLRPARAVPGRVPGGGPRHGPAPAALDHLQPRRGRRVRRARASGSTPRRTATVAHGAIGCAIWLNDQSPRPPARARQRRGARPGRPPRAPPRHPARAALLGRGPALRGDHRHAVHQRPLHPRGRSRGADRRRHRGARDGGREAVRLHRASRRRPAPPSGGWPGSRRVPWR